VPGPVLAVVVTLVVAVLVAGGAWWSRRQALDRRVGSFRCDLGRHGKHWSSGVAQYGAVTLYWWRFWSLAPRPARRWDRDGLTIVERRAAEPRDGAGDGYVVRCRARADGRPVEFVLFMSPEAYAGLTSWIEATPLRVGSVI
jgi:hypothetical protein